ncbi:MAG: hypothetical protein GXP28_01140 [Planctomycetes bacterium]|nr:hypothetical protein [Planctomycetota bacterium]
MAEIADYTWLTGSEAAPWLAEFAESDQSVLRLLGRLRKVLGAERSRLIVDQIALRRRATSKFGTLAKRMFFTDLGLQQSTDLGIARYKAARLRPKIRALDYCSGIGGDLLALAERTSVVGWDRSPEIACLARANFRAVDCAGSVEMQVGNVEDQTPRADEVWHLDPDRRADGRRSTQVEWHSPGPEVVDRWLKVAPQGILKLAPAALVPERWQCEAELEWITRDRECRQLIVWFGQLATAAGQRRATVLKGSLDRATPMVPHSFQGDPRIVAPRASSLQKYVYEVDPAVRAAGLSGALAVEYELTALAPGSAYLTREHRVDHPLLACFEVIDHLPFRVGSLKNHLQSLGIGRLEIKKRGVKVDPEQLRKQLKLRGSGSATLLIGKLGLQEIAILAARKS